MKLNVKAATAVAAALTIAGCSGSKEFDAPQPYTAGGYPVPAQGYNQPYQANGGDDQGAQPAPGYPLVPDGSAYPPAPEGSGYAPPPNDSGYGAPYAGPQGSAPGYDALPPGVDPSTAGDGPRGTSGSGQASGRYDSIGYAGIGGAGASSGNLQPGSYVEITSLDSGRTLVTQINDRNPAAPGHIIDLSPQAASMLGLSGSGMDGVRVRLITPTASDQAAIASGNPPLRLDAPQALLAGLRSQLPAIGPVPRPFTPSPRPGTAPRPASAPSAPRSGGYIVQVAALSNRARADALATQLGGFVSAGGGLYRVQIGPIADRAGADRARAKVASQGFSDARVFENR